MSPIHASPKSWAKFGIGLEAPIVSRPQLPDTSYFAPVSGIHDRLGEPCHIWEKPPRGGKLFAGISAVMTESLLVPEVPARELGSESDLRILVRSRFAIFPISSVSAFDHSG